MNYQKLLQQIIGVTLVTLLLIGCGVSEATVEPQDRQTIIQTTLPTLSPTPIPTFTPVLPTPPTAIVAPPSDTPNPNMETSLPSEQIDVPDLAYRSHRVVFNPGTCGWDGGQIAVSFDNIGEADAGPFTVSIEGQMVRLNGLPAGSSADANAQYDSVLGGVTALIDSNDEVIESDETNNAIGVTHTPPPTCTLTPTPTPTFTPVLPPPSGTPNPNIETSLPSEQIDLPDLAASGHLRVVFNPGTCGWSGGQITVSFDNIGVADAGPFVVRIGKQSVVQVDGLPAGSSADASAQYDGVLGGITALVDSNDDVIESDETNNAISTLPTTPPTCTVTPIPVATMTATPTP